MENPIDWAATMDALRRYQDSGRTPEAARIYRQAIADATPHPERLAAWIIVGSNAS